MHTHACTSMQTLQCVYNIHVCILQHTTEYYSYSIMLLGLYKILDQQCDLFVHDPLSSSPRLPCDHLYTPVRYVYIVASSVKKGDIGILTYPDQVTMQSVL